MGFLPDAERFRTITNGQAHDLVARSWRLLFWWLRWPYSLGVFLRNKLYDWQWKKSIRVPSPVISIGNLTLGGTGKTPCVEYIARQLRDLGRSVVIVSRGYGAEQGPNDEALMLEEALPDVPHLQNRDRVEAALTAITELEAEVLILDDGFQHRRLHRDLDIVLIDSSAGLLQDYLFPRGTLREPVGNVARADVLILTRYKNTPQDSDLKTELQKRFPGKPILLASHRPTELLDCDGGIHPLEFARDKPVAMLCGIGNPRAFAETIESVTGRAPQSEQLFPDHHNYTREDVERLRQWADTLPEKALILTTHKDLVKLRINELAGRPVLAVRIEFQLLEGEERLQERLVALWPEQDEI
jgi:tetraacyldisaccharide 4'-kinase